MSKDIEKKDHSSAEIASESTGKCPPKQYQGRRKWRELYEDHISRARGTIRTGEICILVLGPKNHTHTPQEYTHGSLSTHGCRTPTIQQRSKEWPYELKKGLKHMLCDVEETILRVDCTEAESNSQTRHSHNNPKKDKARSTRIVI